MALVQTIKEIIVSDVVINTEGRELLLSPKNYDELMKTKDDLVHIENGELFFGGIRCVKCK